MACTKKKKKKVRWSPKSVNAMSFFKKLKAVRGAITSANTKESIKEDTLLLYTKIIEVNNIKESDIVSVQFSVTSDLTAYNPCTVLREAGLLDQTALFASSEPEIEGSLNSVIRVLILYYGRKKTVFVYEKGATILRGKTCR